MLLALLGGVSAGAWATSYISYNGTTQDSNTTISSSNVSSGSAGKISWTGTSCSYSSNRVNIAANGSITFTATTGYQITKIVITSGSSSDYYGTWTSTPSVTPSSSSGTTTFDGLSASSVTVKTSTAFRCTSASSIKVYYATAPSKTTTTLVISSTNLNDGNLALTVPNGSTETLTATVTPSGASALDNPTITWTSSDATIASVSSTGVVTPLKEGSTTITASYAGDATYDKSSNTCLVTVSDARTAVNLSTFTATNTTLIAGGTPSSTATSVTNDQVGWTAAYTYSSSNDAVATVNASGVITAVAKGTAIITCSLNVDAEDEDYKTGTTASKTIEITVNNPSHTVTFSSNGSTYGEPAEVEEGESITLPAVNPSVDGKSFRGWVTTQIAGTTNTTPDFVSSPVMGTADVTYYAVFADVVAGVEVAKSTEITPSTNGVPTSYGTANTFAEKTLDGFKYKIQQMYKNGEKLQWRASGNDNGTGIMYNTDAISKIQSIVITYDASDSNKNFTVKVGASENPTSGTSITPSSSSNVYTFNCSAGTYNYFVLTNGTGAGYLTSIVINYKTVSPDTYENYCTTVSNLPLAVVTLSTDAIEMTWGETGKTLTATATVNEEELDETITYTSSSANLTINSSTGAITCNIPGDYTITASVAATAEHQAGQAVCNVTVTKKDIDLSFVNAEVVKMDEDLEYTQTATASPVAYDGSITYAITSSSSEDAEIDENTGELTFINTGVIEVTATAAATSLYNSNTATYTLYVKTTPTIAVSNQSVAYGSTFTVDDSMIEGGDITVTPTSTAIATADGLVLTPVAVGSTAITISTAASDTYIAGEASFTLTVTAPSGVTTNTATETIFYESFNSSTGSIESAWGNTSGSGTATADNEGWDFGSSKGGAGSSIKLGSSSTAGTAKTPSISVTSGTAYTLTFKAAPWGTESATMSLAVTGGSAKGLSTSNMTTKTWNDLSATITASSSTMSITFNASQKRFFLDEVRITAPLTTTSVTTTGGLATYCYQYPLDLDGIEGAKAYKVKSVDVENSKVKMEQITGTIKGGVPFILKSDGDDATFTIPLADESETVPASNALVGTLAPTFVAQTSGDYTNFAYSKSNECFVKLADAGNTVPANRAYLPINLGSGSGVKAFTLFFDDTATGITETRTIKEAEAIYNLAGQRMSKMQKGINIVNGRKVLVQ